MLLRVLRVRVDYEARTAGNRDEILPVVTTAWRLRGHLGEADLRVTVGHFPAALLLPTARTLRHR